MIFSYNLSKKKIAQYAEKIYFRQIFLHVDSIKLKVNKCKHSPIGKFCVVKKIKFKLKESTTNTFKK